MIVKVLFLHQLTHNTYDNRLFFESPVQYMKVPSSEHVVFLFWYSEQFMYTTCSDLGIFMYWTGGSMNNLLSYCGLVEVRISASEKDLPVKALFYHPQYFKFEVMEIKYLLQVECEWLRHFSFSIFRTRLLNSCKFSIWYSLKILQIF